MNEAPVQQPWYDTATTAVGDFGDRAISTMFRHGQPLQGDQNGLALTGMILGILSIVFFWTGIFGEIEGIALALIFSCIALRRTTTQPWHGFAIAGLCTGLVGGLIWFLLGIVSLAAGGIPWIF